VIAFRAFKQPLFKTDWTRRNALQHHSRLATRTTRTLDCGQELLGGGHNASLRWAGALPTLSHRWLPTGWGDDWNRMAQSIANTLVNIAHIPKELMVASRAAG
jgi:hypothetical protein